MPWTRIIPPVNITQVKNSDGVVINPSIEEKQNDILDELRKTDQSVFDCILKELELINKQLEKIRS